jgi:hypothetical protein
MDMPLPRPLQLTVEYIVNQKLQQELARKNPDLQEIKWLRCEADRMQVKLDLELLNYEASQRVETSMRKLEKQPENETRMQQLIDLLEALQDTPIKPDYWHAQNIAFRIKQTVYETYKTRSEQNDQVAKVWCDKFEQLYNALNLKA